MSVYVLGIDPGFANVGWALVDVSGVFRVEAVGVIRTTPAKKKQRVLGSDDEFRRCKEIAREIGGLIRVHEVKLICAESMSSGMPNSKTQRLMAYCIGVLAGLATEHVVPFAQETPKRIKKRLCGRSNVTDEVLHAEVRERYPEMGELASLLKVPATKREHCYDAVGAVEACADGEVMLTLRRMARCR